MYNWNENMNFFIYFFNKYLSSHAEVNIHERHMNEQVELTGNVDMLNIK